jgi:hypothetical protein
MSDSWSDVNFQKFARPGNREALAVLDIAENELLTAARKVVTAPTYTPKPGTLHQRTETDQAGRQWTVFSGDRPSWMDRWKLPTKRLACRKSDPAPLMLARVVPGAERSATGFPRTSVATPPPRPAGKSRSDRG